MAESIAEYIAKLPKVQRDMFETTFNTMRKNADPLLEEGMQYNLPSFYVPHSVYPNGYHCDPKQPLPFASLAMNKGGQMSIHMFCEYNDSDERSRLEKEWKKAGCKWNAGKACIRAKKLEDIPQKVLGAAIKRMSVKKFIKSYETKIPESKKKAMAKKAAKVLTKTKPTSKTLGKPMKSTAKGPKTSHSQRRSARK